MARQYNYDETKLKPKQKEAAVEMVEYEFLPKGERKTHEQIAEDVGISRKTLHNWNHYDQNYINYKNSLSAQMMDSKLGFVFNRILQSIDNGSVKAMDMFLKRMGELDQKSEVTIHDGNGEERTTEERQDELRKRLEQLGEQSDEN